MTEKKIPDRIDREIFRARGRSELEGPELRSIGVTAIIYAIAVGVVLGYLLKVFIG